MISRLTPEFPNEIHTLVSVVTGDIPFPSEPPTCTPRDQGRYVEENGGLSQSGMRMPRLTEPASEASRHPPAARSDPPLADRCEERGWRGDGMTRAGLRRGSPSSGRLVKPNLPGQHQEPSYERHNSNGKLRYSWSVGLVLQRRFPLRGDSYEEIEPATAPLRSFHDR